MKKSILVLLIVVPFTAGCYVSGDQIADLQKRQSALEKKMDALSEQLESNQTVLIRDVERIENNQLLLAEEIENIQEKNITLKRKIDEVTEDSEPGFGTNRDALALNPPKDEYIMATESYKSGRYEDAILEYQKFIDTSPKDSRLPNAYLGQGLSLMGLGRRDEAKYFFNTLIDKYPESTAAKTARAQLRTIQ